MQVSVESVSNLERRMTVQVPAERIDNEVDSRLKSLKGRVRLNGFRPGKVPLKVVKQQYGAGVYQEVVSEVVQSSFQEAVMQEKLNPAGRPDIKPVGDTFKPGEQFEYVATFEVYPKVELADLSSVEIAEKKAEVTDQDIDNLIENLRKQRQTWKADENKAAEKGDQVVLDFEGFIDGEAFEGGKAEGMTLVLGDGRMIPGFEEQLEGVHAGDETDLQVTFPEKYHAENLAGKEARFAVKVNAVNVAELPEVDEEFVKGFGVEDGSVDKLREEVAGNLTRELTQKMRAQIKEQVMERLYEMHQIDVPSALVTSEINNLRQQMMQQANQTDTSHFPDEMFSVEAKRRVMLGLIIGEIIESNKITLEKERVDAALSEIAASYEDPEEVIGYYRSDKNLLSGLEAAVLEDQVVDWVKQQATVIEEQVSFDDLMNPPKPEGEKNS